MGAALVVPDVAEPGSGWTSLALSLGGILTLVAGLGFVWAFIAGQMTNGSAINFAVMGLILAPCLSIGGWMVGNRYAHHPAGLRPSFWEGGDRPGDHERQPQNTDNDMGDKAMRTTPLALDGRTLGKLGLIVSVLPALAALGFYFLAALAGSAGPST